MSTTYFPVDYFNYVLYGASSSGTTTLPVKSGNQIMNILQNVAAGLGDAISANQIRIYADEDFPAISSSLVPVLLEMHPVTLRSIPILSTTTGALMALHFAARITLRVKQVSKAEIVMAAMTKATLFITGNTFGLTCIGSRSKVDKMTTTEVEPGVFQVLISGSILSIM
jgi:hypothetical protein